MSVSVAATAAAGPSTTPSLATLADSQPRLMDAAAMEYFLIEAVQTLRHSSAVADSRAQKIENEMIEAGLIPPPPPAPQVKAKKDAQRDSVMVGPSAPSDDEEEGLRARLEAIGMHVGANITERLCHDRAGFADTLDIVKFVCKELWSTCWDKQVDNLRTNHRGVYVLQDNSFKPIARISSWESRADATRRARLYVAMSAGMIRGALMRLGLHGTVTPEINLPQCVFLTTLSRTLC
ncbi:NO signaling/Golgi transport ligand-binding domain-containing protein [Lactarius akahatsu]|uniref:NO signaling/Golgi transport ligand-binding domain-containing protein n=1 Tax=Lactarius akahatsu TaxID=416441 RepID=A0AAD4LBY8_9AGAM|nr:NO signaling/Golgi transport ligand-binding domain-containing protein [Lactarius akahatsu]